MDAAKPQQVQYDGEQNDKEANQEQVVVVDEGEVVSPVGVCSFQALLWDVPGRKTNRHQLSVERQHCVFVIQTA